MSDLSVLNCEMFAEAEAARLLRVPRGTLHYWLEGGAQRGRTYKPIIREKATGNRSVTWTEFVEAGLLGSYRKHRVPMIELRAFIDLLRDEYGVPYPLAHHEPFVGGRRGRQLVLRAHDAAHLDADFCLVASASGQLILTGPSTDFYERVRWDGDLAAGWRPHDDPSSPVLMVSDLRFGRPAVGASAPM